MTLHLGTPCPWLCARGHRWKFSGSRKTVGKDDEPWARIYLPDPYPIIPATLWCYPVIKCCSNAAAGKAWCDIPATEGPVDFCPAGSKKAGIPTVSGFHTNFDLYLKHYKISVIKPLVDGYLKWFHNKTMATFAPTDWMIDELENKGHENVRRLSRGVNRELFSPTKRSEELRRSWNAGEIDRVLICIQLLRKKPRSACKSQERIEQGKESDYCGWWTRKRKIILGVSTTNFPGCLRKRTCRTLCICRYFYFYQHHRDFGNVVTGSPYLGLTSGGLWLCGKLNISN